MVTLWGRQYTREELRQHYGDVSQLGGIRPVTLADGPARGTQALDIATGTGFRFTVLLDRGMDISEASYQGKSLCWRSCTGDKHPAYFQHGALEWLRHFFGGLVLTCGLTQAGAPCRDEQTGEELGIHGRYTALAASLVQLDQGWDGDEFVMCARGTMRDSVVFFENIVLTRTIRTRLGSNAFAIEDRIENAGYLPAPLMLLYHCNFGFPVIDAASQLLIATPTVQPRDPQAEAGIDWWNGFRAPTPGFREQCHFYDPLPDSEGWATIAIVNPDCDGGFGAWVRYNKDALPWFTQWKMMGQGNYTCGLEPANCLPLGRDAWRRTGHLQVLAPGETRNVTLEIGCVVGAGEIDALAAKIAATAKAAGVSQPRILPRYSEVQPNR